MRPEINVHNHKLDNLKLKSTTRLSAVLFSTVLDQDFCQEISTIYMCVCVYVFLRFSSSKAANM